jgi:hypothetical protein
MAKPHGRKIRQKVREILESPDRESALEQLACIPDNQLTGHLFYHFYAKDELIRFRSVTAMGFVGKRLTENYMEGARNLMRRLMWNLNDESGGIGWGSAEAMGEVLSQSPAMAVEFDSILFSFLDTKANYIDNPQLQQGILWGIGTYAKADPAQVTGYRAGLIAPFLGCSDPVKKGYAVRALIHAGHLGRVSLPGPIQSDPTQILIYTGWQFDTCRICDLAQVCNKASGRTQAPGKQGNDR